MKAGEWLYLCVAHGNDGAMEVRSFIFYPSPPLFIEFNMIRSSNAVLSTTPYTLSTVLLLSSTLLASFLRASRSHTLPFDTSHPSRVASAVSSPMHFSTIKKLSRPLKPKMPFMRVSLPLQLNLNLYLPSSLLYPSEAQVTRPTKRVRHPHLEEGRLRREIRLSSPAPPRRSPCNKGRP